ncbi:hypothetical protein PLICRDRAFT_235082 [Plicaturopsis crispa FD-325 SS-3]|nr:hypothetical protein PLICRDRAFT_235082 [Plicaturopsis crispa FD-325 SS-3]
MPVTDTPQATSSHMMKTTKRGRPFLKDTLDLFATLIVSLRLTTHKQFFKTFPNSFTTDDAAQNLASLKFSQSNRGPDPREPSRVVTTTTTTTFSMTREMAKAMSQHFMDARLIENAADPSSNLFKDRGVYVLTPKGLHVLERFISKNGISSDHLHQVFTSQPICIKLLHLERRSLDDEIIVTQSVISALFRRFVGKSPNYPPTTPVTDVFEVYKERSKGVSLSDVTDRSQLIGKGQPVTHKYCFAAVTALEWLCDFTSVVGREEAAEMAAQFVRFGLITLVSDKRKNNDSAIIFTVRGSAPGGNSPVSQHGEFRCTAKAIYRVTDEGRRLSWDTARPHHESPSTSSANLPMTRSSQDISTSDTNSTDASSKDSKLHRRTSVQNLSGADDRRAKESNTDRLRFILEDPSLRNLFREFLRSNFCEENLAYYMDVLDFKRKFNITSSAVAVVPASRRTDKNTPGQLAMEKHHESLIQTACDIYNTYLARSSPNELNIDHALRNELSEYLGLVLLNQPNKAYLGRMEPEQANTFNATQLQTTITLYERIQHHVFRLMATDSVPKFIKTPRFLQMRQGADDDWDGIQDLTVPPGLNPGEEIGRAYLTVSQHREWQQPQLQKTMTPPGQ